MIYIYITILLYHIVIYCNIYTCNHCIVYKHRLLENVSLVGAAGVFQYLKNATFALFGEHSCMVWCAFISFLTLSAGLQPSVLRELSYSGVRMGLYEPLREMLVSFKGQAWM